MNTKHKLSWFIAGALVLACLGFTLYPAGIRMTSITPARPLYINASGDITNASGTPDGTKFMRDDGVLAVPAGSGGGSGVQTNADQFAPNVVLNVKDGAKLTNVFNDGKITQTGGGVGIDMTGALLMRGGNVLDADAVPRASMPSSGSGPTYSWRLYGTNGANDIGLEVDKNGRRITASNATFNLLPGSGSIVAADTGGALFRTNVTGGSGGNFSTNTDGSANFTGGGGAEASIVLFGTNGQGVMAFTLPGNYPGTITNRFNFTNGAPGQVLTVVSSNNNVITWGISNAPISQGASAVLSNLVGTVGSNVTNVISLSTSNATSKPITNSFSSGTLRLFGLEAGANTTITPNGSNLVIASSGGGSGGNFSTNAAGDALFIGSQTNQGDVWMEDLVLGSPRKAVEFIGGASPALMIGGGTIDVLGGIGDASSPHSIHLDTDTSGYGLTLGVAWGGFVPRDAFSLGASTQPFGNIYGSNIHLKGGSPGIGKVLTDSDGTGAGVWSAMNGGLTITNTPTSKDMEVSSTSPSTAMWISRNAPRAWPTGMTNIVVAGDSKATTTGGLVAWPNILTNLVTSFRLKTNSSVSGQKASTILSGYAANTGNWAPGASSNTLLIIDAGINDLFQGTNAVGLINTLNELSVNAHSNGFWVMISTLTPSGFNTTAGPETNRVLFNTMIRTNTMWDYLFDAVNAMPHTPIWFTNDMLHFSDAGKRLYADGVVHTLDGGLKNPRSITPALWDNTGPFVFAGPADTQAARGLNHQVLVRSSNTVVVGYANDGDGTHVAIAFASNVGNFNLMTNGENFAFPTTMFFQMNGTDQTLKAKKQFVAEIGVKFGVNGTAITNVLAASATLDFPSTAAGAVSDLPITVTGCVDGDAVQLGTPSGSVTTMNGSFSCWSSNGACYVRFANNNLVSAQDPASGTFKVVVTKW